jgi:multidrug efflux pump
MTFLQAGQDVRIGGRQSNAQYQYAIQSENLQDLVKWGPIVLAEMRKLSGFTDVNSDQQNSGLQASLTYDRPTAARLGISAQLIDDTLYDAFGQRQVSTMFTSLNQYHVVMEVDPQFWQSPTGLDAIYMRPNATAPGVTPSPSPTPAGSGGSSTATSTSQSASAPSPIPVPSVAGASPTVGPIAAPTPLPLFPGFVQNPTPDAVATPSATPAAAPTVSVGATSSATGATTTPAPIAVATPSAALGTLLLVPTTTPAPAPWTFVPAPLSTPASSVVASTSDSGGGSTPTPSPTPGVVPLSAIASYQPTTAPIAVNHQGQFPSVTISFNLAGGMALSEAVAAIQQMQQRIGLPATVQGNFSGTAQAFQASLAGEPFLILAALAAVYIVLGILYESYIHPITILSTLPSAGVGAVLALMLSHTDLSVIAIIGILLLIGIVKKNAILMIDFALEAERKGMPPYEAIYQACLLRFRPIMMTTTAALFGALPLVTSTGMGAELRWPLGITIVGGLIFSQALTLYTTPVIYLALDRLRERRTLRPSRGKSEPALGWQAPQPSAS